MKILLADDDLDMVDVTAYALRREGHTVVTASDGQQALDRWQSEKPELLLLDIIMPEVDGFEICRRIREASSVPIMMLTARQKEEDIVRAFELGVDDYLTKPFSIKQLNLRINALMRRAAAEATRGLANRLRVGDLTMDLDSQETAKNGKSIRLTRLEFRILYCLAANDGRVVATDRLLDYAWGEDGAGDPSLLKTHISHIRRKLGLQPGQPGYIKCCIGVGYTLVRQQNP